MASARKEWVYVMSNPSMPGRVKVGQSGTRHPSERAAELFNTGVPTPFVIEYEALIEGAAIDIERAAHMQLVGVRDVGREFFRCKPSVAVHAVQMRLARSLSMRTTKAARGRSRWYFCAARRRSDCKGKQNVRLPWPRSWQPNSRRQHMNARASSQKYPRTLSC